MRMGTRGFKKEGRPGGARALPIAGGGFTLLELIVAMLILSLVALLAVQGLRLGHRAWEKGEAKASHHHRVRIALDTVFRQISSAYPLSVKDSEGKDSLLFKVEGEELRFVTTRPVGRGQGGGGGGLFFVVYALKEDIDSGELSLVAYQRPVYMIEDFKEFDVYSFTEEERAEEREITLIAGVTGVEWRYSWKEGEEGEGPFEEGFDDEKNSLPREVTLSVGHREGGRDYFTEVTVPVMMGLKAPFQSVKTGES
ncbi:MAG: type II secretion system protein [Thermodesulfobacteriota bacterium]